MSRKTKPSEVWKPEIREDGAVYSIESEKAAGIRYTVDLKGPICSCPHFGYRGEICKHIEAVKTHVAEKVIVMRKEQKYMIETVLASVPKVEALARKARSLGCEVLATDLHRIGQELQVAADIQTRALSEDSAIRIAALAEAAAPFRIL